MGKIKTLLLLLILVAFLGAAYYLITAWQDSQNTTSSSSSETEWDEVTSSSSGSFTPSSDVAEENINTIVDPPDWRYYRNSQYGIALNVPQKILGTDHCLERKFEVPTKLFEDHFTNAVFVVPEYSYERYTPSADELRDKSGDIIFEEDDSLDEGNPNLSDTDGDGKNDCRKRYYSLPLIAKELNSSTERLPLLGNPVLGMAIRTNEVKDTADLNSFIIRVFGKGCVLSNKTSIKDREGLYRLEIAKSGKKDNYGQEMGCATQKVTDIIYNPSRNRITYALRPQGGIFFSAEGDIFDEDMILSINLE